MDDSDARWFLAIELPEPTRDMLTESAMRRLPEGGTPSSAAKLHLTMLYVGRVDPSDRRRFKELCAERAKSMPGFELELVGIGSFPLARVAKVGVGDGRHQLVELWGQLHTATLGIGDSPRVHPGETEPTFDPHITIGRYGPDVSEADIAADIDPDWRGPRLTVTEVALVSSADGRYDIVDRFELASS